MTKQQVKDNIDQDIRLKSSANSISPENVGKNMKDVVDLIPDLTVGSQGPRGIQGNPGSQGLQGINGTNGTDGLPGINGNILVSSIGNNIFEAIIPFTRQQLILNNYILTHNLNVNRYISEHICYPKDNVLNANINLILTTTELIYKNIIDSYKYIDNNSIELLNFNNYQSNFIDTDIIFYVVRYTTSNNTQNAPTANIIWEKNRTNQNLSGSENPIQVDYENLIDLDNNTILTYWQQDTGSGFIDIQQTNITPFTYNLSIGLNLLRLKMIDSTGLIGYSNTLEYNYIPNSIPNFTYTNPIMCSGSNFGSSAPSCGNSGTLTINSGSHTIKAVASIYTGSTMGVTANITVNGISMSISNASGQGQDYYSTNSIILGPGTYSYSYTVTFSGNNGSAGGGIYIQ